MFAFKTNIPKLRAKIDEEIALIQGGFAKDLTETVIDPLVKVVKDLTPRSEGEGSFKGRNARGQFSAGAMHLQDGWTKKSIGGGGKDRAPVFFVIWNALTHKRTGEPKKAALLKNADGKEHDYTLLDVIEYGSPGHRIEAVKKRALRFNWLGQVRYAKSVQHPGTSPKAPVRKARVWAGVAIKAFTKRWAEKIAQTWNK